MGTDVRGFLKDDDAKFFITRFVGELFEPDGGAETCRACGIDVSRSLS